MKQSTPLSQKLAGYSALAAALTGFASSTDAQITYSGDKTQPITPSHGQVGFDLNDDGTIDCKFICYTSAFKFTGQNGAKWVKGKYSYSSSNLLPFNLNDNIDANNSGFSVTAPYGFGHSNFLNQSDKYIGVKFQNNTLSKTYIGWIRVNFTFGSITIKDWAYEEVLNSTTSIIAGQTSIPTALEQVPSQPTSALNIYPTITKENITIESENAATYQLIDITGVVINEGNVEVGKNTINTSSLKKGIYIVKIINESGSAVKRIVKE